MALSQRLTTVKRGELQRGIFLGMLRQLTICKKDF